MTTTVSELRVLIADIVVRNSKVPLADLLRHHGIDTTKPYTQRDHPDCEMHEFIQAIAFVLLPLMTTTVSELRVLIADIVVRNSKVPLADLLRHHGIDTTKPYTQRDHPDCEMHEFIQAIAFVLLPLSHP